jgi:DNA-binding transcriptional ArsR family regulator
LVRARQLPSSTAPLFAALGDPCRLSIIDRLCEAGPLPTIKLNDSGMGVSRQGLTKHLRVLEDAGLVDSFRAGRDRHWQVRTEQFATLRAYLDQVSIEWETRLERLKCLVEEEAGS